jgi:Na+-dependent transporters of the SNF family
MTSLLAGCMTFSILGHIAQEQGIEVSNVVKSGPGLVFLTYPEVVLKLPGAPAWSAIFFFMLVVRSYNSMDGNLTVDSRSAERANLLRKLNVQYRLHKISDVPFPVSG